MRQPKDFDPLLRDGEPPAPRIHFFEALSITAALLLWLGLGFWLGYLFAGG